MNAATPPMAPALKLRTPDVRWTRTMASATSAVSDPVAMPSSTKRSAASLNNAVAVRLNACLDWRGAPACGPPGDKQSRGPDSTVWKPDRAGHRGLLCATGLLTEERTLELTPQ